MKGKIQKSDKGMGLSIRFSLMLLFWDFLDSRGQELKNQQRPIREP